MAIHITDVHTCQVCEAMCLFIQHSLKNSEYIGCIGSSGAVRKPRPIWVFRKQASNPSDSMLSNQPNSSKLSNQSSRALEAGSLLKRHYPEVYRRINGGNIDDKKKENFGKSEKIEGRDEAESGAELNISSNMSGGIETRRIKDRVGKLNTANCKVEIPDYTSSTVLSLAGYPSKYGEFFDLKADQLRTKKQKFKKSQIIWLQS